MNSCFLFYSSKEAPTFFYSLGDTIEGVYYPSKLILIIWKLQNFIKTKGYQQFLHFFYNKKQSISKITNLAASWVSINLNLISTILKPSNKKKKEDKLHTMKMKKSVNLTLKGWSRPEDDSSIWGSSIGSNSCLMQEAKVNHKKKKTDSTTKIRMKTKKCRNLYELKVGWMLKMGIGVDGAE